MPNDLVILSSALIIIFSLFITLITRAEKRERKEKKNDIWDKKKNVSLREIEERIFEEAYVKKKLFEEKNKPYVTVNKNLIERKIEELENRHTDIQKN